MKRLLGGIVVASFVLAGAAFASDSPTMFGGLFDVDAPGDGVVSSVGSGNPVERSLSADLEQEQQRLLYPLDPSQVPLPHDEVSDEGEAADSEGGGDKDIFGGPSVAPRYVTQLLAGPLRRNVAVPASGSLSPRSLRREVQSYAQRIAADENFGVDDGEANSAESACNALLVLLVQVIASMPPDVRFETMQERVLARVLAGTCDWYFMQDISCQLVEIVAPKEVAEVSFEMGSDGGSDGAVADDEQDVASQLSIADVLERLRSLRDGGGIVTADYVDKIKSAVRTLIDNNSQILGSAKCAELYSMIDAKMGFMTLITICTIIEDLRVVANCKGVAAYHEHDKHDRRNYCNPRNVFIVGLLTAAVAVFAKVLIDSGVSPL